MSGPGESVASASSKPKTKIGSLVFVSLALWAISGYGTWWLYQGARGKLLLIDNLNQGVAYEIVHATDKPMGDGVGYLVEVRSLPPKDPPDGKPSESRWYNLLSLPPDRHFVVTNVYGKVYLVKNPEAQ